MAESHRDEIAKLEALYASNPDGRVFTHLAEAYRRAGELGRAREILGRGLQRHSEYASAHVVLGRVLVDQGLGGEAAASFRRVLELDPENLIARRSLAESDRAAGRDEDALVHYRELLAHDPSDDDLRMTVAELETRLNPPARPAPAQPEQGWAASHAEESWEPLPSGPPAPEPLSIDPSMFGGQPVQPLDEPVPFDDEPARPLEEPISLDSVSFGGDLPGTSDAFDLSTVDFGATELPPAEAGLSLADFGDVTGAEPAPGAETEQGGETELEGVAGSGPPDAVMEPVSPEDAHAGDAQASSSAPDIEGYAGEEPTQPAAAEPEGALDPHGWGEWPGAAPTETGDTHAGPGVEPPTEPSQTAFASDSSSKPSGELAAADAEAGVDDALGVPTETLAALYRAQGFPDRAAGVYQALLRERPDDVALRERADAMAAEAAAQRARQTGVEETREVWLSGGADTWDADERVAATHALDVEEDATGEPAGPTIGAYFEQLLTWRPAVSPADTEGPTREVEPEEAVREAEVQPAETGVGPFTFDGTPTEEPQIWDVSADQAEDPRTPFSFDIEPALVEEQEPGEEEADEATSLPFMFEPEGAEPETAVREPFEEAPPAQPIEAASSFAFDVEGTDEDDASPQPFIFEIDEEEGEPEPFSFEGMETETEEPAEPLPFELETIELEEETAEPLPFELPVERLEVAEEPPGGPAPFEVDAREDEVEDVAEPMPWEFEAPRADSAAQSAEEETSPPFLIDEPAAEPVEPTAEAEMLFLNEAEAVEEQEEAGWDPTVALADVVAAAHARPSSRTSPARSAPALQEDEEDDDDLEMFRSWLQSLKK